MSAQIVTTFSLEYLFLTLSVNLLPFARFFSSILQTIILGFILSRPKLDKNLFCSSFSSV